MTMGSWRSVLVFGISLLSISAGAATPDYVQYLEFRNESREARNRIFLGRLEEGEAAIALSRAKYVLNMIQNLSPSAVSLFEHLDAMLAVMKAQFAVERGAYHIEESKTAARIANLRAEWALSGKPAPKELAILNLELRRARIQLLTKLEQELAPYARTLAEKYERVQSLLRSQSISRDEANVHQLAHEGAAGLVALAKSELEYANAELVEAERELALTESIPSK